jgi:hypothetical protein
MATALGVGTLLLLTAVFVMAIVLGLRTAMKRSAEFEERFPPISDDEFMALCPPGTSRDVALKVRRIMADQLGVEYERIYPSSRIVADLGCE